MKRIFFALSITLFIITGALAQNDTFETIKVEARPARGFAYPYLLYIPKTLRLTAPARKVTFTILVAPNNTGVPNDDLIVHEASAKKQLIIYGKIASKLETLILMPVFPRPKTNDLIYTHALDRDSLLTDKKEFSRFDLQLLAMIDDARRKLEKERIFTEKRVFMTGFSASGMFTNRFTFLHPDRIKAAAAGSPGGWPIAPEEFYRGKVLRYPIGIGDFKSVTGKKIDLKTLRNVPMLIYMGDKDENDSVVYTDGYDVEDKDLIFNFFGNTPLARWEISKSLYQKSLRNATFKLYPDVKHTITNEMIADIVMFFRKTIQ